MDAYSEAIAKAVRPNDAVVDLGCGPGIFAMLACKAGARRVYAIDMNAVVDFGRHLAAVNGLSDRIHFLRGDSQQIHLPERADVIVSDVRGVVPLFSHAVETLQDARDRFLAAGGRLLPAQDTLMAAIVELQEPYETISQAWKSVPQLNLSSGRPLVLNTVHRLHIKPQHLLSEPRPWHVIDYISGAAKPAQANLEFVASRSATAHGIGIWFETTLMEGIGYSTKPRATASVYGHLFLPWLEPVSLREGQVCCVDLRANRVGKDYIWKWDTKIPAANGFDGISFQQSTFFGALFPPSTLQKRALDFVPVLTENGLAERWLLQAMDGQRPLESIAAEAAKLFPHVFRRPEDAFHQASEIAEKFSR